MEVHGSNALSQTLSDEEDQRSMPLFGGAAAVNQPELGSMCMVPRRSTTSAAGIRTSDIRRVLEQPSVIWDSLLRNGTYAPAEARFFMPKGADGSPLT